MVLTTLYCMDSTLLCTVLHPLPGGVLDCSIKAGWSIDIEQFGGAIVGWSSIEFTIE